LDSNVRYCKIIKGFKIF